MGPWVVLAALLAQVPSATLEQRAVAILLGEHPFTARAEIAEELGAAVGS